jgi:hypothetical protein
MYPVRIHHRKNMGKSLKEGTVNAVNSDTAHRIKEGIHTALVRGSNSYAAKVASDYIRDNTPSFSEHAHSIGHIFYPSHPTLDRVINADTPTIRKRNPATIINATSRPNEPEFVPPFVSNVTTAPITVRTKRKHHKNPTNAPTTTTVSVNFPSHVMPTSPPPLTSVPPPPITPVVRPVPVRPPISSNYGEVIFTNTPLTVQDDTKAIIPYVAPEVKKEEVVNNKIKERAVGRLPDNVDMNLVNYYISHPAKINTSRTYNYSNIKDRQLIAARYLSTK